MVTALRRAAVLHLLAALLIASAITGWQVARRAPVYPYADAHGYLSIGYDIATLGTFTDGSQGGTERRAGMFFAPLYPAFIAAWLKLDGTFAATARCLMESPLAEMRKRCPADYGGFTAVQTALAVIAALGVFVAGRIVCRSYPCAWLAMLLALATGTYAYYARRFLTENLVLPLFTLTSILLVLAWQRRTGWLWLAAGAALGASALVRPAFAYLFYAAVPCAAAALIWRDRFAWRRSLLFCALLVVGYGAIVAPWLVRNWLTFDQAAITGGYASFTLAQRLAYNAMSGPEWLVSFIYWLPDFGDSWAAALFDPDLYRRLSFDAPDGFYRVGLGAFRSETLAAAGGSEAHLGYLIEHHLLADLPKHLMVTLALAWRGMWVAKYWGLLTIVAFVPVFVLAVRRRWSAFIVLALPPWFMLGFHAFTSVNVVRYNLILIPCLAIGAAWALVRIGEHGARRLGSKGERW